MNEKINKVQTHIHRNRAKYAVAGTLTACLAAQYAVTKTWNKFLDEHDLTDEYYNNED